MGESVTGQARRLRKAKAGRKTAAATTARSAQSRDYETIFVRDAVGGPDLEYLDGRPYPSAQVLEDVAAALAAGFAEVLSTEDVLSRLEA